MTELPAQVPENAEGVFRPRTGQEIRRKLLILCCMIVTHRIKYLVVCYTSHIVEYLSLPFDGAYFRSTIPARFVHSPPVRFYTRFTRQ